jgi:hypothetical protein
LKDSFNIVIQKTNEFNLLIEDAMNMLPDTSRNYKLKKQIESAYRTLKRSMERHEDTITDSVPPIGGKIECPPEFNETWNIYKDYMTEQFGIRMGSRMEKYRLKLLYETAEKDFNKATRWLQYYMAAGSSNIYPVNDFKIKKEDEQPEKRTAGFILPTKAN